MNEADLRDSIRRINLYGLILMILLLLINLYVALVVQGRSLPPGTIRIMVVIGFMLLGLVMVNRVSHRITAFLLLSSMYLCFFIYPLLPVAHKPAEDFFLLIFSATILMLIPYIMFHIVREQVYIFGWIVVMATSFFFIESILIGKLVGTTYSQLRDVILDEPIFIYAFAGSQLFIHISVYRYRMSYLRQNMEIEKTNNSLKEKLDEARDQHYELEKSSYELRILQDEIKGANEELELKVKKRTSQLEMQNRMLRNYAFMNSSLLRQPILELMSLLSSEMERDDESHISSKLEEIILDLDEITLAIGEVLNNQNSEKINTLEKKIKLKYPE